MYPPGEMCRIPSIELVRQKPPDERYHIAQKVRKLKNKFTFLVRPRNLNTTQRSLIFYSDTAPCIATSATLI